MREFARKNRWRVNSEWHEKVRNNRDHNCRAAWSLLGYTPYYRSFNTSRMVSGIDSVLRGEGVSSGSATTAVPSLATMTVAIPIGHLVESGHRASALPVPEPDRTSGAEPRPSRRKRLVASSSSESSASSSSEEEEEEGEMLRCRRPVCHGLQGHRGRGPGSPSSH